MIEEKKVRLLAKRVVSNSKKCLTQAAEADAYRMIRHFLQENFNIKIK